MVTANYGNNDDPDALGKRPQDELHVVDVFEEIIFDNLNLQPESEDTDEIYNSSRHKILNFLVKYNLQDVDALSHYIEFCDKFEECLESVDNLQFTINIGNCISNEDCLRRRNENQKIKEFLEFFINKKISDFDSLKKLIGSCNKGRVK